MTTIVAVGGGPAIAGARGGRRGSGRALRRVAAMGSSSSGAAVAAARLGRTCRGGRGRGDNKRGGHEGFTLLDVLARVGVAVVVCCGERTIGRRKRRLVRLVSKQISFLMVSLKKNV